MRKLGTILILLALVGGGAYYYFWGGEPEEEPQVVQVTIAEGTVTEVVQATGTLEPVRLVNVGSQVSGIVDNVYVDFNSIVRRGQLVADIDPRLLQVQVDLQEANVSRQEGEIANQEVQLEDARKQLERAEALFKRELATQQQLDQAILTVKQRETGLDAARKQLLTAQANLNQAELNVSYTKIYAPEDGVVVQRMVDPGQAVQASMNAPQFFTIATDLRQLILTAGVDEADIGRIAPGMAVEFQVDTYPNSSFTGKVEEVRLNATTQSNVVTYPVRISVPNPDLRLFPSMTAALEIIIRTAENVVRLPNQATRFRPTNEMFLALGLEPPVQTGRALAAGGNGGGGDQLAAAARGGAAPTAEAGRGGEAAQPSPEGAPGGQTPAGNGQAAAQNGRQGGRGGVDPSSMTPEERQRMAAQFAAGGGGGGRSGRGGRGRNGGAAAAPAALVELTDGKIDELRTALPVRVQTAQVWQWNPETNELVSKRVQIGISDGQFSQLVSGEISVGDQVVTNIVLPVSSADRIQNQQNLFNQRGGFGGGGRGGGRGF